MTDVMDFSKSDQVRNFAIRDFQQSITKTGVQQDVVDMHRLGKEQELRRNFKTFSILGMAAVTMATWISVIQASTFSLINGGLAGTVWVYLASWIFTICLVCSLAEMVSSFCSTSCALADLTKASMSPTSGGQYREYLVDRARPRTC